MPAQKPNSVSKAKSKTGSAKPNKSKAKTMKTTDTTCSVLSSPPDLVVEKNTSKSKPKKKSSPKPKVEVAEPIVAIVSDTVTEQESVSTIEQIEKDFVSISTKLSELKSFQTVIVSDLKKLQKNVQKHIKETRKKKKRVVDPNRPKRNPSGFAKPAPLSTKLCDFLDKPYGTEMARTDVTREITQYIKKENLQDEKNRRIILPDAKLQSLMNFPEGADDEPITYFNLQKFLRVHFLKKDENGQIAKTI